MDALFGEPKDRLQLPANVSLLDFWTCRWPGHMGTRAQPDPRAHGHTGTRAQPRSTGTRAQPRSTGTRAHGHGSSAVTILPSAPLTEVSPSTGEASSSPLLLSSASLQASPFHRRPSSSSSSHLCLFLCLSFPFLSGHFLFLWGSCRGPNPVGPKRLVSARTLFLLLSLPVLHVFVLKARRGPDGLAGLYGPVASPRCAGPRVFRSAFYRVYVLALYLASVSGIFFWYLF